MPLINKLIVTLIFLLLFGCGESPHNNVTNCKKLTVGMSYEEVYKIMGEPKQVSSFQENGRDMKTIYYSANPLSSTVPTCLFDVDEDKLIHVVCDESN